MVECGGAILSLFLFRRGTHLRKSQQPNRMSWVVPADYAPFPAIRSVANCGTVMPTSSATPHLHARVHNTRLDVDSTSLGHSHDSKG